MDKMSQIFVKTSREDPSEELALNAKLLIRAGFIYKEMAGVYAFLPLGLKVLTKIEDIVREEMNKIGGQELIMTSLQKKSVWEKTDRWDDQKVDVWFKTKLKNETELGLAWSHEEQITEMMKSYISSYRDLPKNVYQFQTKFRNEARSKSGIMRCREFLMKDMYSYSLDEKQHQEFYDLVTQTYLTIFKKLGLGDKTYLTFASGGDFTEFSHEFQTICEAGEDIIYINKEKNIAINEEVLNDQVLAKLAIDRKDLVQTKAAEVGNIFYFGSTKSEQMDLYYNTEEGERKPVIMGSYGIGITRLMGVMAEIFNDGKGLKWPKLVAPYDAVIVNLLTESESDKADELARILEGQGLSVLMDDRDGSAGQKLADADLIGIPYRFVISNKSLQQGGVSLKLRTEAEEKIVSFEDIPNSIK